MRKLSRLRKYSLVGLSASLVLVVVLYGVFGKDNVTSTITSRVAAQGSTSTFTPGPTETPKPTPTGSYDNPTALPGPPERPAVPNATFWASTSTPPSPAETAVPFTPIP